jgi:hypothetical protein
MRNTYAPTLPTPITEDRFVYMLDILPPCRWMRGDHVEWFHISERLSGNLVEWFVRVGDAHYSFVDEATLTSQQVRAKALK